MKESRHHECGHCLKCQQDLHIGHTMAFLLKLFFHIYNHLGNIVKVFLSLRGKILSYKSLFWKRI